MKFSTRAKPWKTIRSILKGMKVGDSIRLDGRQAQYGLAKELGIKITTEMVDGELIMRRLK